MLAANKPPPEPKEADTAPSLGPRKLSNLLGKKTLGVKRDDASEMSGDECASAGAGGKRGSLMPSMMSMSQRTSISTASGKQPMGLMASRREEGESHALNDVHVTEDQ